MSSSSVWVQLYYEDTRRGRPTSVRKPKDVEEKEWNVDALARAVLPRLDPAELAEVFVYPAGTTPTFSPDESLDPGGQVPLGTTPSNPLIVVAPDPQQTHDPSQDAPIQLAEMAQKQRRYHMLPPPNEPQVWVGRTEAEAAVYEAALQNYVRRTSTNHGDFSYLIASGHVRSGKTRTGIESSRVVERVCKEARMVGESVADPVYLRIDFLNGSRFNHQFDSLDRPMSEALGARLIYAFYDEYMLYGVRHDIALDHIVAHIQGDDPDVIVPIVVHIDEHGDFIADMNRACKSDAGHDYFLGMLKLLGSAATSNEGYLAAKHRHGTFFLIPITTGTSHSAANINRVSRYQIKPVPLPLLNLKESEKLASHCLEATTPGDEPQTINAIIRDPLFRIALGDTGGLPGLIYFLSNPKREGISYVQHLHNQTREYVGANWDHRWESLTSVYLARPPVTKTTVLMTEYQHKSSLVVYATREELSRDCPDADAADIVVSKYTVGDALDGGTVFWQADDEIGLAPALLAKFNGGRGMFNPVLTKEISLAQGWTWQEFEKAHLLFLAATMAALVREKERFDKLTLGTFLRYARPSTSSVLNEELELPPSFNCADYFNDPTQCIPRSNAKSQTRLFVSLDDFESVWLTKDGIPIVDGYLNLKLKAAGTGRVGGKTMFLQYKHSGLSSKTSDVNVSTMNSEVNKLAARLKKHAGWPDDRGWIFLWITNREVVEDAQPDSRLLWVDKLSLAQHAPLLGARGLVPEEELRQDND